MLGHIDTVQPKDGWRTDPLTPTVQRGKLYGLGAADMKSSLAAFLWALVKEKPNISLDDVMLLIYVDEEYDFRGIRRFIEDEAMPVILPQLTLSLDGELAVGTGCRGLIEFSFVATGRSGHASNPANGVNAITESMVAIAELKQTLGDFVDDDLGQTTLNVAAIRGGSRRISLDGEVFWLEEGNIIADSARMVLEVRPSVPVVNAAYVKARLKVLLAQRGLELTDITVRHDIAPWPVSRDAETLKLLRKVYAEAEVSFRMSDRKLQGYIDAQMVTEKIAVPTFIIGTGGENKHGADENVPLQNIEDAAKVYRELLREVLA